MKLLIVVNSDVKTSYVDIQKTSSYLKVPEKIDTVTLKLNILRLRKTLI